MRLDQKTKDRLKPGCICKGVKLVRIIEAIEDGAASFEEIASKVGIGDGSCGGKRCGQKVAELLARKVEAMCSRLDILIYAHDGRGLGHASRCVAIGMALRRMYPTLKVLFVSGTPFVGELIGPAPLDWLKLPAYATTVVDGISKGIGGPSNFSDRELAQLRAKTLEQLVLLYRPRTVLCDHSPVGKHKELIPALRILEDTRWLMGIRGVIGTVPQVFSEVAASTFDQYFDKILWYGDKCILGDNGYKNLGRWYATRPVECGYVSRLRELAYWQQSLRETAKRYAGTVSIPWNGEQSEQLVRHLAEALKKIGTAYGRWKLFLNADNNRQFPALSQWFKGLDHVSIERPGSHYAETLSQSKTALIYGGYNSLTDVLSLKIPAVVLLRPLQDDEQQEHLQRLTRYTGNQLYILREQEVTADTLAEAFRKQLVTTPEATRIDLNGAEKAAQFLGQQILSHTEHSENPVPINNKGM